MSDLLKTLLTNQFEAAFCTLNRCVERCPDDGWDGPVGNLAFSQVVFHTLFFADYYLEASDKTLRQQPFHSANTEAFQDYEELQTRKQTLLYEKRFIERYLIHCRTKAIKVLQEESEETLSEPCRFPRKPSMSRAELHVYNLRHIQHHISQLSLRLRLDWEEDIPWFGSGWQS